MDSENNLSDLNNMSIINYSDFEDATSPLKVRLKDIDITKDSDIKVEEYGIIRKKHYLNRIQIKRINPTTLKR